MATRLAAAAKRPLLVAHCAAHRLQLSVSAALHADAYLAEFEKAVNRLFRFLMGPSGGGGTHLLGLLFWAGVADEDLLASLGTGKAR